MKKLYLALVVFALIVSGSSANILTNGGFETSANGWTLEGYVGCQSWAIYDGTNGIAFSGWDPAPAGTAGSGSFYQEVTNGVAPGTYTFTVRARQESAFQRLTNAVQLGWYNAAGTKLQQDTTAYFTSVPSDPDNGDWHLVRVTGSCISTELARIRVSVTSSWVSGGGALMFDDADLYTGTYAGATLRNGSFEDVGSEVDRVRSRKWVLNPLVPPGGGWAMDDWEQRSGTNGIALYSFASESNNYQTAIKQSVYPAGTGTYTFAVYIKREANFLLNSAGLSVKIYAEDYTNKVQDDVSTNLTLPLDGQWHEYYVSLSVTSPAAFELRPQIDVSWMYNTTGTAPARAAMIDDARWLPGAYADALNTDWAYYAAPGYDPLEEMVPGTNGFGPFLAVNYVTHTNTFYLLTDAGPLARYPGEDAVVQLRTAWQVPGTDTWVQAYTTMERVATVGIPATNAFHGFPAAGTQEVAVWKCNWEQPRNPTNGVLYSNEAITVFYAPFMKTTNGIMETDYKFLTKLADSTTVTNNLGQFLGDNYASVDYSIFSCKGSMLGAFTNGGFEDPTGPAGPLTLAGSGWFGSPGGLERADWGWRSGGRALLLYGWNPGSARVFQDVATTGGIFSFSSYVKVEGGVTNLTELGLRMEWYTADGGLAQVNEESLLDIARDYGWHAASVVGSCRQTNLAYVRLSIQGEYGPSDAGGEAIQFDDAQFRQLTFQPQNTGFENPLDGSGWLNEGNTGRESWGGRVGTYVLGFHGWSSGRAHVYQDVASTGGVLKFSTWAKAEPGATNVAALSIRMEWYKGDGTLVQTNVVSLFDMPRTYEWEEVCVVGACQEPGVEYVRLGMDGQWGVSDHAENKSMMFDEAQLVAVSTNLQNVGFETGFGDATPEWYSWSKELARIESWANHSGTNGVAFRTWIRNAFLLSRYETTLGQPISVTPGTYSFSIWLMRDALATLTNAELRIEWYGGDYPNKVQADTVLPLTIPTAGVWNQYTVTGQCVSAGLRIAKPVLFAQWNTAAADSLKIDDAVFAAVAGDTGFTDGIPNEWWDRYGITGGGRVAANDTDFDDLTHFEEYVADTVPTNINSSFSNAVRAANGTSVMTVQAGPPTTNSRVYDVWWKTNLMDGADWTPYNWDIPGDAGGGAIQFSVTNDAGKRFYRTGVQIP